MTTPYPLLLSPVELGSLQLRNRLIMAPLTRARCPDGVPGPVNVEYYRQRAGAGMIVSEGIEISPQGRGAWKAPGLASEDQIAGWRCVTDAVHSEGGLIVAQLWHAGRMSHPGFLPPGMHPVAPSQIAANGTVATSSGRQQLVEPHQLSEQQIHATIRDYASAAERAIAAGFDGVELHGANGYLIDEFLRSGSNRRSDAWGGGVAGRCRFLREVTEAVVGVVGHGRTGVRLSPTNPIGGLADDNPEALFAQAMKDLKRIGIAYLHLIEGDTSGSPTVEDRVLTRSLRKHFDGAFVLNNGFTFATAERAIADGLASAVSFGRPYIANPDLPDRAREGLSLTPVDRATVYGDGSRGYTDYPAAHVDGCRA